MKHQRGRAGAIITGSQTAPSTFKISLDLHLFGRGCHPQSVYHFFLFPNANKNEKRSKTKIDPSDCTGIVDVQLPSPAVKTLGAHFNFKSGVVVDRDDALINTSDTTLFFSGNQMQTKQTLECHPFALTRFIVSTLCATVKPNIKYS